MVDRLKKFHRENECFENHHLPQDRKTRADPYGAPRIATIETKMEKLEHKSPYITRKLLAYQTTRNLLPFCLFLTPIIPDS